MLSAEKCFCKTLAFGNSSAVASHKHSQVIFTAGSTKASVNSSMWKVFKTRSNHVVLGINTVWKHSEEPVGCFNSLASAPFRWPWKPAEGLPLWACLEEGDLALLTVRCQPSAPGTIWIQGCCLVALAAARSGYSQLATPYRAPYNPSLYKYCIGKRINKRSCKYFFFLQEEFHKIFPICLSSEDYDILQFNH